MHRKYNVSHKSNFLMQTSFLDIKLYIFTQIPAMKTEPAKPGVKPPLTPQSSLDSKGPAVTSSDCSRPRADPWVEDQLTTSEMENVTTVFRYFETGLREATILPKVIYFICSTTKIIHI